MTRGCRTHATTTTSIMAAIPDGVTIVDPRNSATQQWYCGYSKHWVVFRTTFLKMVQDRNYIKDFQASTTTSTAATSAAFVCNILQYQRLRKNCNHYQLQIKALSTTLISIMEFKQNKIERIVLKCNFPILQNKKQKVCSRYTTKKQGKIVNQ